MVDEKDVDVEEDNETKLRAELENTKKRLDDTFRSYQEVNRKNAELHRNIENEALKLRRPELLDNTEGLQEAIKYVHEIESNKPTEKDLWVQNVSAAIPDIDEFMKDDGFRAAAHEQREKVGDKAWEDPFTAIRELAILRAEMLKKAAVEEAKLTMKEKESKVSVMDIPRGGGKSKKEDPVDEAEQIRTMSNDEFQKLKRQKKGY